MSTSSALRVRLYTGFFLDGCNRSMDVVDRGMKSLCVCVHAGQASAPTQAVQTTLHCKKKRLIAETTVKNFLVILSGCEKMQQPPTRHKRLVGTRKKTRSCDEESLIWSAAPTTKVLVPCLTTGGTLRSRLAQPSPPGADPTRTHLTHPVSQFAREAVARAHVESTELISSHLSFLDLPVAPKVQFPFADASAPSD